MWGSVAGGGSGALCAPQIFLRSSLSGAAAALPPALGSCSWEEDLGSENSCLSLFVSFWKKSSCAWGAGARHRSPLGWRAVPLCPDRVRGGQGLPWAGLSTSVHQEHDTERVHSSPSPAGQRWPQAVPCQPLAHC